MSSNQSPQALSSLGPDRRANRGFWPDPAADSKESTIRKEFDWSFVQI
jgi:hypothetical protein